MEDLNPVFRIPKVAIRLAWGVIVQGFIKIVRMALEIPMASNSETPGILPQAS